MDLGIAGGLRRERWDLMTSWKETWILMNLPCAIVVVGESGVVGQEGKVNQDFRIRQWKLQEVHAL
jgi:hypothetical protein